MIYDISHIYVCIYIYIYIHTYVYTQYIYSQQPGCDVAVTIQISRSAFPPSPSRFCLPICLYQSLSLSQSLSPCRFLSARLFSPLSLSASVATFLCSRQASAQPTRRARARRPCCSRRCGVLRCSSTRPSMSSCACPLCLFHLLCLPPSSPPLPSAALCCPLLPSAALRSPPLPFAPLRSPPVRSPPLPSALLRSPPLSC